MSARPHLYRASALASGFVRMWRGWRVIAPVVVVNALLQASLVWPSVTSGYGWWVLVSAVLSAVVFGLSFGLVASTALEVADGPVRWRAAAVRLRTHLVDYTLWALVWFAAVVVGLAFDTIPGLVVAALLPFLLLAALDGHRNALAVNLRTVGRRFWRWLITMSIVGLVLVAADLSAGLFTFFMRNPVASAVVWLLGGVGVAWVTTTWALIYRSAWGEPVPTAGEPTPDLEPTP